MSETLSTNGKSIGRLYDQQSNVYVQFADRRFSWRYLERPAYDRYIGDLYTPETHVLDIGCGTGVVARYLISKGILPRNIIGIDTSKGQLEKARIMTPGVRFIEAAAEDFNLPPGSVDLAITNTVLHHLDNEQLEQMLERVYRVLSPRGIYFFVDVDPDHSAEGRDSRNTNKWTTVKTPWGTEIPFFNRDPYDLTDILDRHGFEKVSGWVLKVSPEGIEEPTEYTRYVSHPSRMAARYQKVSEQTRFLRMHDVRCPHLIESPSETAQRELIEEYFHAWQTQFDYKIIGISAKGDAMWAEFAGGFDVRGRHININGVIGFTTNQEASKITRLTEFFKTKKTRLEQTS